MEELNGSNVSLSQNRKEDLYQYWLKLQKQFLMDDSGRYQEEFCYLIKEYFFKAIESYPTADFNTYFESVYGFLSGDNLWYNYETQLVSSSYYDAYNWMY